MDSFVKLKAPSDRLLMERIVKKKNGKNYMVHYGTTSAKSVMLYFKF